MRSHAKASSAGSSRHRANGLGRIVRGAIATRGASGGTDGSGAPSFAWPGLAVPAAIFAAVLFALALFAIPAGAAKTHLFQETFGSAEQPSVGIPGGIAVDQSSGDVLVMDNGSSTIKRYHADGTPAAFSALGTNVIDGEGLGGSCTPPSADCDETPQNGLSFAAQNESQIAVDNSGTVTDGDIYVTQSFPNAINIFAETGRYLGQLTGTGTSSFSEACGVTVDPNGAVYVGDYVDVIDKFVPSANPPVNADSTASFGSVSEPCILAAGAGPSAGYLFAARYAGGVKKLDSATGEEKYTVSSDSTTTLSVDPTSGNLFQATGSSVKEFDASGAASAAQVSTISPGSSVQGVGNHGATGDIYVARSGNSTLDVYGGPAVLIPTVTTEPASGVTGIKATLNGSVSPEELELEECFFEWGETAEYGETVPCAETPAEIGSGSSPVPVHADLSGLTPNATEYHFRLVATNENGTVDGSDQSFATSSKVLAEAATGLTGTKATLHGQVNPEGHELDECRFAYGETIAYGETVPCAETPAEIGTGTGLFSVHADLSGLSPNSTTYHFRLVVVDENGTFPSPDNSFITPDTVFTEGSSGITATEASVAGKVNPDGLTLSSCEFEFGRTESYGQSAPCVPNPAGIGSGTAPVPVEAALSGLEIGAQYHYRLAADYGNGPVGGADQTFITLGPFAHGEFATKVGTAGATLNGAVNPKGVSSTYHFEYVSDAEFQANGFANATKKPVPDGFAGSATADFPISIGIAGLQPATTYHFRLVATNSVGVSHGAGATFTTFLSAPTFGACPNEQFRTGPSATLPDCRAYEQASQVDKDGYDVTGSVDTVQASLAGDGVTFWSPSGLPNSVGGENLEPALARRSGGNWSTSGLLPPATFSSGGEVVGWTPDLSTVFQVGTLFSTFERTNVARNSANGSFTRLPGEDIGSFRGATANGSEALFESRAVLAPGALGGKLNLFLWNKATNTFSLVGVLPDSACATPPCYPEQGSSDGGTIAGVYRISSLFENYPQEENALSSDGDRAYFNDQTNGAIYLREGLTDPNPTTVPVSASQRTTPDPHGPLPATMQYASPDGSTALFTSCEKLTNDSTAISSGAKVCNTSSQDKDLYRWQLDGTGSCNTAPGCLTDLTVDGADAKGADVRGVLGASEDGSYVYFAANGVLAANAGALGAHATQGDCAGEWTGSGTSGFSSGSCNLYLSHNGATTFIGPFRSDAFRAFDVLNWSPGDQEEAQARVSRDGKTLVFVSSFRQTSYDSGGDREIYRYHVGDPEILCVSCSPTGAAPNGGAGFDSQHTNPASLPIGSRKLARYVSADGNRVFFETADKLVQADVNGDQGCPEVHMGTGYLFPACQDVYEWEAEGTGSCESSSQNGGCLYLISNGTGSTPVFFGDASPSGNDVFFFTRDQLVPQDTDNLIDVYDASAAGGLAAQHAVEPPACAGDSCHGPATSPPSSQGAATASFSGPGNPAPKRSKHRKPRKHRKHQQHKKRHQQRANANRRTHR